MGGGNPSDTVASEGDKEDNDDGYVEVSDPDSSSSTVHESRGPEQARRDRAHDEVLQLYSSMQVRIGTRAVAKDRIRRYKPGDWIEGVGGTTRSDYEIPDTTTLLIVGPEGSGKSSLVNRISRAFEDDVSSPDRAQVAYNWSVGMGTHYFKEYMIPRGSSAFCVYDTRGLSNDRSENLGLIKKWMTEGVRHGDLDLRSLDLSGEMRVRKTASQIGGHYRKRAVNFVIFVVDMTSVLKSMNARDKCYTDLVADAFSSPFLSFKDDKPVIVLTHGDELSRFDRARVRIHLGEVLGVPPTKQFFEIPDTDDWSTDLAIVEMLRHCLERADRNLPLKKTSPLEMWKTLDRARSFEAWVLLLEVCLLCFTYMMIISKNRREEHVDWHSIRHLWLG